MATKVLNTKIVIRNDTAVNFTNQNPTLLKGEIAFELDTEKYKIGNGINNYVDLPYYNHINDGKNNKINTLIEMLNNNSFGSISDVKVNGTSVIKDKIANVTIASISYSTASQTIDSDKLTSEQITLHRVAKTGSWNDLVGKPNVVDNLSSTSSTDILSAKQGNELKKLIQAVPQATSFATIDAMISNLKSASNTAYNVGHDLYIAEKEVPDFWVSSKQETFVEYTGDSTTLITALKQYDSVQIGYYKISILETVKVDISNYVTTEELNSAITALGIDDLKAKVNKIETTVGDTSSGLVKDVANLKTTNQGFETRIKAIEEDATIIRTTDFVVLNGGDSKTAN